MFLVAAATATAGAGVASATPGFTFDRIADQGTVAPSPDRYGTSVATAQAFGNSPTVILASGEGTHTVDALSAAYLAGMKNAPILLTKVDTTPKSVADYLASSGVTNITIVGGTSAVSAAQQAALSTKYTVTRVDGTAFADPDRYATSAQVIENGGTAKTDTALLASGNDIKFADPLGAGPLSYAKGLPLALTAANSLPAPTLQALQASKVKNVLIVGGTDAVGQPVVDKLVAEGFTVSRPFNGADRAETSALVAEYAIANYGFSNAAVNVASGYFAGNGADALGGTALSAKENRPLLITNNVNEAGTGIDIDFKTAPRAGQAGFLEEHAPTLTTGHIFGGTGAVSAAVQASMTAAARTPALTNQTLAVTPNTNQTVDVANGAGNVSYTVSGLDNTKTYDIALFSAANVTNASGQVSFNNSSNPGGTGNVALPGSTHAEVTVINGASVLAAAPQNGVIPDNNGQITFTVTDATAESVVPVVFSTTDDNDVLNLGTNNQPTPTDRFGIGGTATFVNNAVAGSFGGGGGAIAPTDAVLSVTGSSFTTGSGTFTFKSGDSFTQSTTVAGVNTVTPLTFAQFVQKLSPGDSIGGNFQPAGTSSFVLADVAPVAPTGVQALAPGATPTSVDNTGKAGIQVNFNDSSTSTVAFYNVFRATATQPTVTGGIVECPLPNSGAFTKVGSVTDTNATNKSFLDSTATVPAAATPTNPQFCYYVTSVDATGQESTPSATTLPFSATAATPATAAPKFASAIATGNTVTLTYAEAIDPATVTSLGSEFTVNSTLAGVTTANAVTAADDTNAAAGEVVLTVALPITATAVVLTEAQLGTDFNTVGNTATPQQFQSTTDAVQAIAS